MRIKLFAVICTLLTGSLFAANTEYKYLSGTGADNTVDWDFFCTAGRQSGKWTKLAVPSCWELHGFGTFNYGGEKNKSDEQGLYKHKFTVPSSWKGKRLFIVFEGSMTDTEIKINGKQAGDIHQGAFYRFKREITDLVKFSGDNLLEVKVSKTSANKSVTAAERDADYWVFGGIFRPVYLEAQPKEFIDYIATDAKADGSILTRVNISDELKGATAKLEITTIEGEKTGAKFSAKFENGKSCVDIKGCIANVKLWSSEYPNRYIATVTLEKNGKVLHKISEKIGFRTIEVKERDGVYVNGVKIRFKGVNRSPFYPTTGRTTSLAMSLEDASLIKEMNMNAVRTSHYPPDKHFLDVCDSVGLYVIDELCAWQTPPYDTPVGTILAKEMIVRDVNHPCIVIWANGNEGGFNFDLDHIFPELDPQKRAVIHPWALFGGINTLHYITYNNGIKETFNGRELFMPTEFLHGLYDGGHGAGLDDNWNLMLSNPLSTGAFLWDFADQGVVRADRNGEIDTDENRGADGIVGPYREKEGSFYTIKEVWSPVYFEKRFITPSWNGNLDIQNRFDFTNTSQCTFSYKLSRFGSLSQAHVTSVEGKIISPNIAPREKGTLQINLPSNWRDYDVLYVTTKDQTGAELFTHSFEIGTSKRFVKRQIKESVGEVKVLDAVDLWRISASDVELVISKGDGLLKSVVSSGIKIPFDNGPIFVSDQDAVPKSVVYSNSDGCAIFKATYAAKDGGRTVFWFTWKIYPSGMVELDFGYRPQLSLRTIGITFDYPENEVEGATILANGPYRVYKNRTKGVTLNLWDKKYNNTVTGESWIYPEFKGYYSLFYGMELKGKYPFKVYCADPDLFLHLFTPEIQKGIEKKKNYTYGNYPKGNISFMHGIPSVGTKFEDYENYGPQSQNYSFKQYGGVIIPEAKLYFDFKR